MPEGFFPFLWCLGLHLTLFAEIQVLEIGSLQRHDPVTVTLFRMPPFHACGHEDAAELLHPDARERARLTLAQQGDELGKGNGQGLFTRTGGTEVAGECFFRRASAVESHVGTLDFRLFPRREPVTPAAERHVLQLGVGLGMVDARAVDGALHLHAEEAAAARRVGKQFVAVGRSDEGGDARQAVEIIAEGMVVGQAVGGHEARHVAVPARDARLVGGEAEGVEVACREGEEGGRILSLGAELRLPRQQVVAQVVTRLRESGQPTLKGGRRAVFRAVCFRLPF